MRLDGHLVRRVTLEDAPAVQALLALDPAYFERVEGAPLRPDEALDVIVDRPPGVPLERKHNFVIASPAPRLAGPEEPQAEDRRVAPRLAGPEEPQAEDRRGDDLAVLSLIEGFPDEGTWYLGLIFVAPAARRRGLGTRAIEALCAHARERGGTALRLAVVPSNTGARRLYDRLGFGFVTRRSRPNWNDTVTEVEVLERPLARR